jgi:large subunit ribosomal protein L30
VTAESQNRIYVKWVRSGIGFSHRQKVMIRSLGLKRLNQVVERPDTPQVRGLVTQLAHLVEVVSAPEQPAWKSTAEHTIRQPQAAASVKPAPSVEPSADVSSQPASQQPSQLASDEGTTQPEMASEEIAAGSTSAAETESVKTETERE